MLSSLVPLVDILFRLRQYDSTHERVFDSEKFPIVPEFRVYIELTDPSDMPHVDPLLGLMILFYVERRRLWRILQSRAGIENPVCCALKLVLSTQDSRELQIQKGPGELFSAEPVNLPDKQSGAAPRSFGWSERTCLESCPTDASTEFL